LTRVILSFTLNSMENNRNELEYDILGLKVKYRPQGEDDAVGPADVVERLMFEVSNIREKKPHLTQAEVATLLALKLQHEKMVLESEYRDNIEKLQLTATDALQYIDEVSPLLS
jgi:cell division protein ZapA (FtsZ GTPase activity inhibitor)